MIIAEIGINHNGDFTKAQQLIKMAFLCGCECVKFQCHIPEDEMLPNNIVPSNANETIWKMMKRCSFSEEQEKELKYLTEAFGMQYLCTPFSRAAADRLERMNVSMYKIGSGECNNYPLIRHIVSFGKPIILSTGMNDFAAIDEAVSIIGDNLFALLHCTSMYPTPYDKVRLGAMLELKERYNTRVGLSDHSIGINTSLAAIALGAELIEKHFTINKTWPGSDIPISIDAFELHALIEGEKQIRMALGGTKEVLPEEQSVIDFAYASVVTITDIKAGDKFTRENIWVKRPGTGEIRAEQYEDILDTVSLHDIKKDTQLKFGDYVRIW